MIQLQRAQCCYGLVFEVNKLFGVASVSMTVGLESDWSTSSF